MTALNRASAKACELRESSAVSDVIASGCCGGVFRNWLESRVRDSQTVAGCM